MKSEETADKLSEFENIEAALQQLEQSNKLLKALTIAQSQFIADENPRIVFDDLLENLLELTQSEYGFIGEVHYTNSDNPDVSPANGGECQLLAYMKIRGKPFLKTHAITNIAWNAETRALYDENAPKGMEFHNLKTLFGAVMVTGEPVIANNPATDPRRGGLPADHPPLNAFLGVPFFYGDQQLLGMVGISNRPGGYDESLIAYLQPFMRTCSNVVAAQRNDRRRQQAEAALRQSQEMLAKANQDLEIRVEERTAELTQALQQLQIEVAERKQAEAALREREQFLRSIWEGVDNGITVLDVLDNGELRYKAFNPAMARMSVVPVETLLGKTLTEALPPDVAAIAHRHFTECLEAGKTIAVEESVTFDGVESWWLSSLTPLRDSTSRISQIVSTTMNISDRKRAEIVLREREQFLASIYDGVEYIIFVADVTEDGEFRYAGWNPQTEKITGISSGDCYGKTVEQLFPPLIAAEYRRRFTECQNVGGPISYETYFPIQGDHTCWMLTLTPLRDVAGRIYRLIGTGINITERKQAEQALAKQKQTLRAIIDNAPIWVWMTDSYGRMQFVNKTLCENSGVPESQWIAAGNTLNLITSQEIAQLLTSDIAYSHRDTPFQTEKIIPFSDGQLHHLEVIKARVKNTSGEAIGLVGLGVDVTQQKQAQLEVKQSEARFRKLAQQEALLNRLANQIRHSLNLDTVLATAVHEIRSVLQIERCLFIWYLPNAESPIWEVVHEAKNAELPSFLGCWPAEATGTLLQTLSTLTIYRVDDINAMPDSAERQFFQSLGYKSLLNLPIQTSSGTIGLIGCNQHSEVRPWRDDEIELLQAVTLQLALAISQAELYSQTQNSAWIAREQATKLEAALQELQRTQTQLVQSEKMSSLGQMIAGIAHEINNPVSFIYGNIEPAGEYIRDLLNLLALYQTHYPNPVSEIEARAEAIEIDFLIDDLPRLLASIKIGATRIRDIVRSLRIFSRLDEAEMKAVDIHESIDSTLMILEHRLKEQTKRPAIKVIKEYGQLPLVECYAGSLNQVFMNLLANAIDALEMSLESAPNVCRKPSSEISENSVIECFAPTIQIRSEIVRENLLAIRITDNGPGMTEDVRKRLFDPFFTTKPVGAGTGLGLSISYEIIVEKHRGELRCISAPGHGAEFVIEIPLQQLNRSV